MNEDLKNYISQARASGQTDDQIRQTLLAQGWKAVDLDQVFSDSNSPKSFGFKAIILVIALLIFGGLAYAGLWYWQNQSSQVSVATFTPRPVIPSPSVTAIASPSTNPQSTWKSYSNTKNYFSLKYPDNLFINFPVAKQTPEQSDVFVFSNFQFKSQDDLKNSLVDLFQNKYQPTSNQFLIIGIKGLVYPLSLCLDTSHRTTGTFQPIKIDGLPALETTKKTSSVATVSDTFLIKDSCFSIGLAYSQNQTDAQTYVDLFHQMISTLKFTK